MIRIGFDLGSVSLWFQLSWVWRSSHGADGVVE